MRFCAADVVSWPRGKAQPMALAVPSGCRKLALGRFVKFGDGGALALSKVLGDPYDNVTGNVATQKIIFSLSFYLNCQRHLQFQIVDLRSCALQRIDSVFRAT